LFYVTSSQADYTGRMPGAVAQDIFWKPPVRRTYKSQLLNDRKKVDERLLSLIRIDMPICHVKRDVGSAEAVL